VLSNLIAGVIVKNKNLKKLKESENYYKTIFENTGSATYIINEDMSILDANNEWKRSFGYDRDELIGCDFFDMLPDNIYKEKIKMLHHLRRETPDKIPKKYKSQVLDKSGRKRDCLVVVDMIPGTKNSIATLTDITQLNRINRSLNTIRAINASRLHAVNELSLLEIVCRNIVNIMGYHFAWIGYVENNKIKPVAFAGSEGGYLDFIKNFPDNTDILSCEIYKAINTLKPYTCQDIETCTHFGPCKNEALKRGFKAFHSIPLITIENGQKGALYIYSDVKEIFDDEEVKLLNEMSKELVIGINFIRTRIERDNWAEKLKESLENTKQLMRQTVDALSAVIRIRDPYTSEHQKKVAKLSLAIAEEMELDEDMKNAVFISASIHDIGKMNIPSDILNKPGAISDLEFDFIHTHCETGYEIIKNVNFPQSIDEIILQHHERMDGTGYPYGITGNNIHLAARIIAVADVVEAMSSHRPYRPALGLDKALEEISLINKSKYDANVVNACLNLFKNKGFVF